MCSGHKKHLSYYLLQGEGRVVRIVVDFIAYRQPFSKHQILSPSLGKKQAKTPELSC